MPALLRITLTEDLSSQLKRCHEEGHLLVINNKEGHIVGVVCWSLRKNNFLYVEDVLCLGSGVLKRMMETFMQRYPGYRICGTTKHGFKRFDPQRLLKLSPEISQSINYMGAGKSPAAPQSPGDVLQAYNTYIPSILQSTVGTENSLLGEGGVGTSAANRAAALNLQLNPAYRG
jgi:hypothetical protein